MATHLGPSFFSIDYSLMSSPRVATMNLLLILFIFFDKVHSIAHLEECLFLDLTHPFNEDTIYWPTSKSFTHNVSFQGQTKDYYYESFDYGANEHGGTHLDAPVHFHEGGQTVEQIPLTRLVGEGCVVDVEKQVDQDHDYLITVQDVKQWETEHGTLHDCILIFRTGFHKKWPNFQLYMGTEKYENRTQTAKNLHFPGIHPDTAEYIVKRRVKAVGIDTASLDYGQSSTFKVHQKLFEANIPGLENLNKLDNLPARRSTIIALPMLIQKGSGAPIRVIAVGWNGAQDYCIRNKVMPLFAQSFTVVIMLLLVFYGPIS